MQKKLCILIMVFSSLASFESKAQITSASNGLTREINDVRLGGGLITPTKINIGTNNLWFKDNFNGSERYDLSNAIGHIYIGDSSNVPVFSFEKIAPTNFSASQNSSSLIISKTKMSNNENVDLFSMATADVSTRNGWLFQNYSNSAGFVSPRLSTFSNANNSWGFSHDLYTRNNSIYAAYQIKLLNYDSMDILGVQTKIKNRDMFLISNGDYHGKETDLFKIDSLGIWGGDAYKNSDSNKILTTDAAGKLRLKTFFSSSTQWRTSGNNIYNNLPGNVGIGTTAINDSNFKLFVETGIRTRKITVDQTAWPDYVFAPDYKIPQLDSLEQFIKTNGHLPEIPKAATVEKDGIDLGNNQALLLKKIEELTLIVINQNKKAEAQQKLLELQNERITKLENLIKN